MARIPDALEMRTYKYGSRSPEDRDRVAEALRAGGRRSEAILLFERRTDAPFLEEERSWAVGDGRVFHLLALRRLGKTIPDDDLREASRAAERAGRWLEARLGWDAVGDEGEIARIAEHLPEALRPVPEPTDED